MRRIHQCNDQSLFRSLPSCFSADFHLTSISVAIYMRQCTSGPGRSLGISIETCLCIIEIVVAKWFLFTISSFSPLVILPSLIPAYHVKTVMEGHLRFSQPLRRVVSLVLRVWSGYDYDDVGFCFFLLLSFAPTLFDWLDKLGNGMAWPIIVVLMVDFATIIVFTWWTVFFFCLDGH